MVRTLHLSDTHINAARDADAGQVAFEASVAEIVDGLAGEEPPGPP